MKKILSLSFLFFSLLGLTATAVDRPKTDDIVYLEDFLDKPVELKTLRATALAATRDGSGILARLRANQSVELLALTPDNYFVKTRIATGLGRGWVSRADLDPVPETVLKEIQLKSIEKEKLKQAIAKKEIELGMSQEIVLKILGKPTSKSSIKEAGGLFEQWTYTAYKSMPLHVTTVHHGTNFYSMASKKVPVGTKVVTFQNNKVIRFETKQEDLTPHKADGLIVPPVYH